ncbi:MAG TPA: DUF2383 domain-containing protein [Longimicrobiales bacterium]
MQGFEHMKGSRAALGALEELVRVGRRSVSAYRAAERRVADHRLQAALAQLRRDHQRHVRELSSILEEVGGAVVAWDGAGAEGPLFEAWSAGAAGPDRVLAALKRAESELCAEYARHVERAYAEPLRAVLVRHLREEEAHQAWLEESRWWRRAVG